MYLRRKLSINIMYALITLLYLVSCNSTPENIIYKKPPKQKRDAISTWLNNSENFNTTDYQTTFYKYYNQKIKEKKFSDAARAMDYVSLKNSGSSFFDAKFIAAIHFFEDNYKNKVSEKEAMFIYTFLGDYYTDRGEFNKAIENYTKNTTVEIVDYESAYQKADAYRTIAWCYYASGNQELAIKNNYKALEYFKRTDNVSAKAGVYLTFSAIYNVTHDYDKALKNIDLAIKYYKYDKDLIFNVYIALHNKINTYDIAKKYDKMNPLVDSVYHAFNKSGVQDISVKASVYTYYAMGLINTGKIDEVKKIIDELEPDVKALNSEVTNIEFRNLTATYEVARGGGQKNIKLIESAIPSLIEKQNFAKVRDCYATLQILATANKDFEKAFEYEVERGRAQDSLSMIETAEKGIELEKKYEAAKRNQEIVLQRQSIINKNVTIGLLISSLIAILVTAVALSLRSKQKKLKTEKLNSQLYTKQLLEKTEEERKRIASDLHDSVSHELLSLKNSFEETAESTNKKIDLIINDIRSISRNLHPIMFDKVGLKSSINQIVERAQSVNNFMVTADIDYKASLPTTAELQIYRIVQEALSNIIKYADAVAAKITLTEDNNNVTLEIKDNGKGFEVNTTLNNNKSFGLHNIIERSRAIGGEAKIQSDSSGTIITVEIKKA